MAQIYTVGASVEKIIEHGGDYNVDQQIDGDTCELDIDFIGTEKNITLNGIIRDYIVDAGSEVNAGDFVEFVGRFAQNEIGTANATCFAADLLDESHVLVAYVNNTATPKYAKFFVVTLGESGIVVGETYTDSSVSFSTLKSKARLICLSANRAIYAVNSSSSVSVSGTSGYVILFDISISSSTISTRGAYVVSSQENIENTLCMAKVANNEIIIAYSVYYTSRVSSTTRYYIESYANAIKIEDSITVSLNKKIYSDSWETSFVFTTPPIAICYAGVENRAFVSLLTRSKSINGFYIYVNESNSIINMTTYSVSFSGSPGTSDWSSAYLGNGKAILCCGGSGVNFIVSLAAAPSFSQISASVILGNLYALSTEKVFAQYYQYAYVVDLSGGTPVVSGRHTIGIAALNYAIIPLSASSALWFYSTSGSQTITPLLINGTTITKQTTTAINAVTVKPATSLIRFGGVAKTSGTAGETVQVYLPGGEVR